MQHSRFPSIRPTGRSLTYVLAVAVIAALGFARESPWLILGAGLLALPASMVALPCYYVAFGLLALIPGANPSSSTGSGTSAADGSTLVTTGTPAAWFTLSTHVVGILALTVAALLDVVLVRALAARRHARSAAPAPGPSSGPATH
ncbi:MAG: hypothetical protein ACXV4A_10200 [Actinomycetes bacterium]